jgi:hypothetical protein
VGKLVDNIIAAKLLKLLTTPFEEMDAFKLGIIDKDGNRIRKPQTMEDERAYNMLVRFIINLKKIFMKKDSGLSLKSLRHSAFLVKEMDLSFEDMEDEELCEEITNILVTLEECDYVGDEYDFLFEDAVVGAPTTNTSGVAAKDNPMKPMLKRKEPVEFSKLREKIKK